MGIFVLLLQIFHSILNVFAVRCRAVLSLCYISKEKYCVRTCMRRPGYFPGWNIELLAFASCLFAPCSFDDLFRPIVPRERAQRAEPAA